MPTNPLWVEHTERAAWDTVQSLRAEIQRERARLDQLLQLQPLLPKLSAALERIASARGISERDPIAIVEAIESALAEKPAEPPPAPKAPEPAPMAAEVRPKREQNLSHPVRWFARMLEREQRSLGAERERPDPADRPRLIRELEARVATLRAAGAAELFETAIQIGSLALRLARVARRADDS